MTDPIPSPPNRLRIAVADDHTLFRDGLVALLSLSDDFEVVGVAGNGAEAVNLCASTRPDLLLVDLSMPGIDGLEVIRTVKERRYCHQCLLLTMHKHSTIGMDARKAGASGYVLKEEAFEELAEALRSVAAGEPFVEPLDLSQSLSPPTPLSPREKTILQLIAKGFITKEIADQLGLSPKTVETFRTRLMKKAGARNLADLVRYAHQTGHIAEFQE